MSFALLPIPRLHMTKNKVVGTFNGCDICHLLGITTSKNKAPSSFWKWCCATRVKWKWCVTQSTDEMMHSPAGIPQTHAVLGGNGASSSSSSSSSSAQQHAGLGGNGSSSSSSDIPHQYAGVVGNGSSSSSGRNNCSNDREVDELLRDSIGGVCASDTSSGEEMCMESPRTVKSANGI